MFHRLPFSRKKYEIVLLAFLAGCSLTGENDIFGITENRDMMYTNGVKITYARHEAESPKLLKTLANPIPSLQFGEKLVPNKYVAEIGQEMYTPDSIGKFELQEDRNPFVGFLYGKLGKEEISTESRTYSSLTLGTVGPNSFADRTQTWFHRSLDMTIPNGWVNQIDNEIVFMHDSGVDIRDFQILCNNTKFEQTSGYSLKLGTWYTGLEFNLTHRYGQNFELFSSALESDWSWNIFNRPYFRLVARDMTLDGNTFSDSHSVDKIPYVFGNEFGLMLEYQGYALKLYVITQSKIFEEQDKDYHTFGGFTVISLFDLY